ncbi:gamma-glutamyltransferase [Porticoccus sp.]|uniref:gamma-glutamyltransferase n=1 Tax=Porticoccus sp. TaxID=2024853 RepID=UPI003F69876A
MGVLILRSILVAMLLPAMLYADDAPVIFEYDDRFHPVYSDSGMVVSQEYLASQVGADILKRGGNAVDAAVATGFALAVTLPQAGNLGGGGFMMVYLAEKDKTLAIDYREMAPAAARQDQFLDRNGEVDKSLSQFSHQAAGVPGTVAGLVHALERYGTMSLSKVMAPAIALARKGFVVNHELAASLNKAAPRLQSHPASANYFFRSDGKPLKAGNLWRQADLAITLELIATRGADGFYRGPVAKLITDEMARGNGLITTRDLVKYRVVERRPVSGIYRGYRVDSMPPPSSGGVHLIQMLNILEGWDLVSHGHNSAAYLHRLIESMRRAYADRSRHLGDPDYYPVPVDRLIDKQYAAQLRKGIDLNRASRSEDVQPHLIVPEESPQTTHFAVWDEQGNVVSNTYTLNFSYGSGIAVTGGGFLLNNEMDDFSAKAGVPNAYGLTGEDANAIGPGKRPLSSMTPTIVFQDGKPVMATGSPGGSTIITVVLQHILNHLDFDMNVAEAAAVPRIHHQWLPDQVVFERGISPDTIRMLEEMGHETSLHTRVLGKVQAIAEQGGRRSGVTDTRWPGGGVAIDK